MKSGFAIKYPDCIMDEILPAIALLDGKVDLKVIELSDIDDSLRADFLIIPGGSPEAATEHKGLKALIQKTYSENGLLAGICNGGIVIASTGLLKNKKCTHTAHPKYAPLPEFRELLDYADKVCMDTIYIDEDVVVDNNIITAKPNATEKFASVILEMLCPSNH